MAHPYAGLYRVCEEAKYMYTPRARRNSRYYHNAQLCSIVIQCLAHRGMRVVFDERTHFARMCTFGNDVSFSRVGGRLLYLISMCENASSCVEGNTIYLWTTATVTEAPGGGKCVTISRARPADASRIEVEGWGVICECPRMDQELFASVIRPVEQP